MDISVLTWNLFHGQDGARLGPTVGSTVLRRGVEDGERLHLNRKWIGEMADVVASRAPTFAALQEVPPLAVDELSQRTGMVAAHSLMPPLVGGTRLRGRLARHNPDLWRTHEGTANVVLIRAPWEIVPGGVWTVRHNPPPFVARRAHALKLSRREAVHWFLEPRRLVAARVRHPAGVTATVISLHCHGSFVWEVIATEVRRILPLVLERIPDDEPVFMAGDFNAAHDHHPAMRAMVEAGLREPGLAELGLDHIFHRNAEVVSPPITLPRALRELPFAWRGGPRSILLSDHDPVEAAYRLPALPQAIPNPGLPF